MSVKDDGGPLCLSTVMLVTSADKSDEEKALLVYKTVFSDTNSM